MQTTTLTRVLRLLILGCTIWAAVAFYDETSFSASMYVDIWCIPIGIIAVVDLLRGPPTCRSVWYLTGLLAAASVAVVVLIGDDDWSGATRLPAMLIYVLATMLVLAERRQLAAARNVT